MYQIGEGIIVSVKGPVNEQGREYTNTANDAKYAYDQRLAECLNRLPFLSQRPNKKADDQQRNRDRVAERQHPADRASDEYQGGAPQRRRQIKTREHPDPVRQQHAPTTADERSEGQGGGDGT